MQYYCDDKNFLGWIKEGGHTINRQSIIAYTTLFHPIVYYVYADKPSIEYGNVLLSNASTEGKVLEAPILLDLSPFTRFDPYPEKIKLFYTILKQEESKKMFNMCDRTLVYGSNIYKGGEVKPVDYSSVSDEFEIINSIKLKVVEV